MTPYLRTCWSSTCASLASRTVWSGKTTETQACWECWACPRHTSRPGPWRPAAGPWAWTWRVALAQPWRPGLTPDIRLGPLAAWPTARPRPSQRTAAPCSRRPVRCTSPRGSCPVYVATWWPTRWRPTASLPRTPASSACAGTWCHSCCPGCSSTAKSTVWVHVVMTNNFNFYIQRYNVI